MLKIKKMSTITWADVDELTGQVEEQYERQKKEVPGATTAQCHALIEKTDAAVDEAAKNVRNLEIVL